MSDHIPTENDIQYLREAVRRRLSPPRAEHSVSVELECAVIARIEGMGEDDIPFLRVAGLLHDLTREVPADEQIRMCNEHKLPLPSDGVLSAAVLHQITSPLLIASDYPEFAVPEVLEPIRTHTTGEAGMSKAQKILFLADMIEPKRKHSACRNMRTYYYTHTQEEGNLDRSVLLTLKGTVSHLLESGSPVSLKTVKAYNDLCGKPGLMKGPVIS